ncbi:MAG: FHA domain-containing protein [Phycisphaeraceae bacterium]
MFKSDGTRRDFPLTHHRTVIGRKRSCDLRIPLTSVSRQHCEIVVEDDIAIIRDLGSSNGTYHNSTRVQEQKLSAGDEVVVGPVVFIVTINGVPEEIRPVRTIVDTTGASPDESAQVTSPPEAMKIESQTEAQPEEEEDLVVEEQQSPTVDLDDPIAALEAMANAESEHGEDTLKPPSDDDSDQDDDDFDIELLAIDDEDEREKD